MRRVGVIIKRTLLAFYDDQMTQHAAALTYYGLMSLFPAVLLGLSLLGLLGEYPRTYNAIIGYLRGVAPADVVAPLDHSLRAGLRHKGTAATALAISAVVALYGTTGVLGHLVVVERDQRALEDRGRAPHRAGPTPVHLTFM